MDYSEWLIWGLLLVLAGVSLWRLRSAKQQHRLNRQKLDFALQSGRMGTWDINLKNGTITCSPEMLHLWGVTQEEFDNNRATLQNKVHPEDLEKMNAAINSAIASDGIYELEYRILPKPNQMRWVFARGRCLYLPGSRQPLRFAGVVYDITNRKEHEEALNHAIRVRDHFLTIAGHELKTPLTNLQLLIQLRQRELKRNESEATKAARVAEKLDEQNAYVRRITRLVNEMLDVSQISEGKLDLLYETFDMCALLKDVVERFTQSEESDDIPIQMGSCQVLVGNWDRFRIEQVLTHLLSNAVKYGNKKPVRISLSQFENDVFIAVRDHGLGIKPEDQTRIFNRFERAISENEVSGMGLGLYIASSIVRLHGGEIRLQSKIGEGSEFTVVLPMNGKAGV